MRRHGDGDGDGDGDGEAEDGAGVEDGEDGETGARLIDAGRPVQKRRIRLAGRRGRKAALRSTSSTKGRLGGN
jgi:hypothetical protein